ncbi:hypothetical protein DVH24_009186 [Malus domestica]|uniref:Uncharacterized protein n=1 Tax=Malus domestica TaxID=3750 RepID=A0A498JT00_MALDO|nr:hypothetical protein DVH24_009186 [Malus domestica]
MHCALQGQPVDCEVPSVAWRNSDRRCGILTFLSLETGGQRRIVELPAQCPYNINHLVVDSLVNMDNLHLLYPPPMNPFKVTRQRVHKMPPLDVTYSVKSFTNRSFTGSSVRHQPRNKTLTNKGTKWNEVPRKSSHNSLTCSDSACTIPNGSNAINSSTMSISNQKIDNTAKRSSRKKNRKKGRQNKKFSINTGSNEPEVLYAGYPNGSSASETCGNNDGDRPLSSSTAPDNSLPDGGTKNSETPNTCTSSSDEAGIPAVGNFGNQVLLKDSGFSIFNGVESIHIQARCYNDLYTKRYSDIHDSFNLDSVSFGSSSDISTTADRDEKHAETETHNIYISEPPSLSSRKGYFSCQSLLNDAMDSYNHTEGTRHGIQGRSNSDVQLVAHNKRSKENIVAPRNSNVSKFGSFGNLHARTGKGNNQSVWQKVKKNESSDCTGELKKACSVYSCNDLPLRESPLLKIPCNAADVNAFPKSEDRKRQKDKVLKKLKRKGGLALKQEYNCYSREESYGSISSLDGCVKDMIEQNDISYHAKGNKGLDLATRSCSPPSCPSTGFQSSKVECMTCESVPTIRLCPNEMDHLESVGNSVSHNENSTIQSPAYLPHLLCNATSQEVQKETSLAESCRQKFSTSGSFTHKWMPVGLKNPGLTNSTRSGSSSLEHSDEATSRRTLKDTAKGNAAFNTHNPVSDVAVVSTCQSSRDLTCSSNGFEGRLPKPSTTDKLINNKLNAANHIKKSDIPRDVNTFEADSNRILEAVNNACRAQLASEAVQMATGHPIGEFERLLYHSSPAIHQSPNSLNCHTCCSRNLVDQVGGVPLCRHETPDITLGCLWQWYEKYGSYGLEIRAEELGNSKRLGADCFAFRAYFVPYLSGIQLFKNGNADYVDTNTWFRVSDASSSSPDTETSKKSSSIGSMPIFSVLLPQSDHKEDAITQPLVNQFCISEQSSASAKDASVRLTDTTGTGDLELLFEYFESEQPHERRPLYNKIKELVRGDGLSHSKAYGDPTKLEYMNLNDLHPRSWYSVAWYPIYRIPDGNFRAAFLTYHSLGHLVRRSAKFEPHNLDACIVSPVVGLQSYNAQAECWFKLRPSAPMQTTITASGLNPCGVLEERLRTLEETASLMARAVVNKGSTTSVNRHPDYEFFLSRRRWRRTS